MNGPRILIIEDDPDVVLLLEDILMEGGYHTDIWTRCTGAVEHIRQTQPQVVLLDLWLEQRGDGWTVLDALREDAATAQLPVIICTADRQAVEAEAARGIDAHCLVLHKPFDLDTLLAIVQAALQGDAALRYREAGA